MLVGSVGAPRVRCTEPGSWSGQWRWSEGEPTASPCFRQSCLELCPQEVGWRWPALGGRHGAQLEALWVWESGLIPSGLCSPRPLLNLCLAQCLPCEKGTAISPAFLCELGALTHVRAPSTGLPPGPDHDPGPSRELCSPWGWSPR